MPEPPPDGGPEAGHRFQLTVRSQGFGSDWLGPAHTVTVRAWDLPAALRKAADLPLSAWAWPSDEVLDEQ